ncbi:MAG: suppressor of fused domain protein [Oscillospiraceae bacterium]|nr:suppressor of fused domain protein [Oscillospiraceae bacterium]
MFGWLKNKKAAEPVETSPGGSAIYKYDEPQKEGLRMPEAVGVYAEEIEAHFATLYPDRAHNVLHEMISDLIHVDVHILRPSAEEAFFVIYTTGMSDLPMCVPDAMPGADTYKHAELFMYLPPTWDPQKALEMDGDQPNENFWPISFIKYLARFPHECRTWLGEGHTIPNGPDYVPILPSSQMSAFVLLGFQGELGEMQAKDGQMVRFYMLQPLSRAETEYKLQHGMNALMARFEEKDVPLVADINRKSLIY